MRHSCGWNSKEAEEYFHVFSSGKKKKKKKKKGFARVLSSALSGICVHTSVPPCLTLRERNAKLEACNHWQSSRPKMQSTPPPPKGQQFDKFKILRNADTDKKKNKKISKKTPKTFWNKNQEEEEKCKGDNRGVGGRQIVHKCRQLC